MDIQALQRDMENAPWSVLNIFDDIDDVEYAFNTLYNNMILKDISTINPRKATGPDRFSPRDLKLCGESSVITGLLPLFKFSLEQSRIPSSWKISRMHTVFKKVDSTDKSNYRPLHMLSIPSKILEATVCRNIDSFTSGCGLCNKNQWGFVKGKSTEGLLTYLTERWKIALDNGNVVGVVFIDFKKAFNCVSHSILDLKLQALGMTGSALEWIRDYLKDRKQFAIVNGCKSELNDVNCGIPQGSLLGPRLFSVYVNDLPDQIKEGEIDMYADDTTRFYIGSSVDAVCDGLNRTLGDVHNWCRNNRLTIHNGKSEVMVINKKSSLAL